LVKVFEPIKSSSAIKISAIDAMQGVVPSG
jgi:hypothetical protein